MTPRPMASSSRWTASAAVLLALSVFTLACGDDGPPRPPVDGGPRTDQGVDLGPDGAVDGGADADAGDAGSSEVNCTADERITLGVDENRRERRVALAAGTGGTLAAWSGKDGDFTNAHVRLLSGEGTAGDVVSLTDDFAEQDAVHASRTSTGFVVAWYNNVPGMGFEVSTRVLDATGIPTAEAQVVTEGDGVRHDNPALAFGQEGPVLVYVEDDTLGGREVYAVPLAADGTMDGTPTMVLPVGYGASQPVLVERPAAAPLLLATDLSTGGVTNERAVWLQPLTGASAADGEPRRVDIDSNAAGDVAAAVTPSDDVGIAFDVRVASIRNEVHYRPVLAGTSDPVGLEEVLADTQAKDPGIASIAGGFAVAFRLLEPSPTIALAFVDVAGEVIGTLGLGDSTEAGGQVSVVATPDGRLWVGWAERGESETTLFARRVTCE
jgi:hypothetical protein